MLQNEVLRRLLIESAGAIAGLTGASLGRATMAIAFRYAVADCVGNGASAGNGSYFTICTVHVGGRIQVASSFRPALFV